MFEEKQHESNCTSEKIKKYNKPTFLILNNLKDRRQLKDQPFF